MIKYFIKYYIYNGNTKFLRSSFILPLLTIVVGCFVMMMSFSIMEGFSTKISDTIYFFDKEQSITINKKEFFNHYNKEDLDSLFNFLINRDYFFNSYEDRVMFINNRNYKTVARVYGIINFNDFKPNQFLLNKYDSFLNSITPYCYLGYNQSLNLNASPNDLVTVTSILDFENLNSFPKENFNVKGVIKSNISRYDDSIFIPFDSILFSKNIFLNINLNKKINKTDLNILDSNFKDGLSYNKDAHLFSDLFYAISYEKFFYAFFGLFIVLISSIMLMGFNVASIIRNVSSIGLLESLGLERRFISLFYILYGLFITLIGFFVAFLLFQTLLILDNNYHIMNYIFDPNIYFDFDLELNFSIIIRILLVTIILNFLSVLYPLYKISKLDIIESIKNRA